MPAIPWSLAHHVALMHGKAYESTAGDPRDGQDAQASTTRDADPGSINMATAAGGAHAVADAAPADANADADAADAHAHALK